MDYVLATVPVKTKSETNMRDRHWSHRWKRRKTQRSTTVMVLKATSDKKVELPCEVMLTRLAPGRLDDDNLRSALKAVRDGVADWLGCDDGAKAPVRWLYDQIVSRKKPYTYAVTVAIRHVEDSSNDKR